MGKWLYLNPDVLAELKGLNDATLPLRCASHAKKFLNANVRSMTKQHTAIAEYSPEETQNNIALKSSLFASLTCKVQLKAAYIGLQDSFKRCQECDFFSLAAPYHDAYLKRNIYIIHIYIIHTHLIYIIIHTCTHYIHVYTYACTYVFMYVYVHTRAHTHICASDADVIAILCLSD